VVGQRDGSKGQGDRYLVPILERLRGEKSLRGFSFLPETESNRMINIYYFHDEEILSPNFFQGGKTISI